METVTLLSLWQYFATVLHYRTPVRTHTLINGQNCPLRKGWDIILPSIGDHRVTKNYQSGVAEDRHKNFCSWLELKRSLFDDNCLED
jgi:hypothetical protein